MSGELKVLRAVPDPPADAHARESDDASLAALGAPLPLGSDAVTRPRRGEPPRRLTDDVLRVLILLGLAVVASILLAPRLVRHDLPDDEKAVGTPARAFVKADRDYAVVDEKATAVQRDAAAARSPSVWDLDTAAALREAQVMHKGLLRLAVALEPIREQYALDDSQVVRRSKDEGARVSGTALAAADPVRAVLAGELALAGVEAPSAEAWSAILKAVWLVPSVLDGLNEVLARVLAEPVVAEQTTLARDAGRGILVRPVPSKVGGEHLLGVASVLDVTAARARAERELAVLLRAQVPDLSTVEANAVARFAASIVRPTLTYNASETDAYRRRASHGVPPVVVRAYRGQIVLRPGALITPQHQLLIQAMGFQQADDMRTRAVVGTCFFVGLLCLVVYLFGARRVFRRTLRVRDIAFLSSLVLVELLGIVAADAAAPVFEAYAPGIPPRVLFFAVPMAMGAMVARLTLPPEVALLLTLVVALLGGVVVEPGMAWAVVAVVASLTGAAGVSMSQRRSALLLAGLAAGAVGAFAALTLELFRGALSGVELVYLLGATVVGGILSGLLVVVVTPAVEALFGYVTERKLYRFADLSHPLLKDLIVHAPGTWHHSMRVAELAEAAARSVGASPVLARVMALYHDVGKITLPQHFSEDQKGDNPHDRLPPEQSAALILKHTDDGVALALEHGLPRVVIDAIEEHHMDNVVESFHARAVASSTPGSRPDIAAFRYRGRPPQTRESALVMLADHIEAAARALETQGPRELRGVVEAFFNRAIAEDALTACDLSLRELGRAREAMQRALLRVHRQEEA